MAVTTNTRKLAALLGASGAGIGTDGLLQAAAVDANIATQAELDALETETDEMRTNIALVAFKAATAGSLAKYNLQDQVIDEFADATGIDTSASTNETLTSGVYSSSVIGNYFGAGVADTTYSTNTDLTVQNTQGSYDGDMVLAEYNTLTINSGVTLSTNKPCRGLFIYVKGNCVINGTISMTANGAYANPASTSNPTWGSAGSDGNTLGADGLRLGLIKSGSTETLTNNGSDFNGCGTAVRTAVALQDNISSNGKIYKVTRTGAAGAAAQTSNTTAGIDAVSGQGSFGTGGGGGGATSSGSTQPSGAGAAGTCWSGGAGGAGVHNSTSSGRDATAYGGPGGGGNFGGNAGGAGNPGGVGNGGHGGTGQTGTGGAIWLIVGGTLSGSGSIVSQGRNGGAFVGNTCGGGGGSGGGSIIVVSAADTSSISMNTNGGLGSVTSPSSYDGGDGGVGYQIKDTGITPASSYSDLILQSIDTAAETEPDFADMVMLIEDTAATPAVVNTDIKGFVSKDSGVTFTEGVLIDEGDWGTNKRILAFHDLDISAQSGTAMCYKITTHNESASKVTKIHATSIGWK